MSNHAIELVVNYAEDKHQMNKIVQNRHANMQIKVLLLYILHALLAHRRILFP